MGDIGPLRFSPHSSCFCRLPQLQAHLQKMRFSLSKVKSLTFKSNSQTTARRVKPIPQMQCIGPANVCKLYSVDTMRCMNAGSDYDEENVQWTCTASLPPEFKLGSTDVSCEGYASSERPLRA